MPSKQSNRPQATPAINDCPNDKASGGMSGRVVDALEVDLHTGAHASLGPKLPNSRTNPPENTAAAAWEGPPPQARQTCHADQLLIQNLLQKHLGVSTPWRLVRPHWRQKHQSKCSLPHHPLGLARLALLERVVARAPSSRLERAAHHPAFAGQVHLHRGIHPRVRHLHASRVLSPI